MPERKPALPELSELHKRHPGLYEPLCRAFADAAAICLGEHHTSPADMDLLHDARCVRELAWKEPSQEALASWQNRDDATEQGAYSVSLAAVEAELGLVALARAETRTGADYYIGFPGTDLENAQRLEVSGTRDGKVRDVHTRLKEELDQARRGMSDRPALACVVGFRAKLIALAEAAEDA